MKTGLVAALDVRVVREGSTWAVCALLSHRQYAQALARYLRERGFAGFVKGYAVCVRCPTFKEREDAEALMQEWYGERVGEWCTNAARHGGVLMGAQPRRRADVPRLPGGAGPGGTSLARRLRPGAEG